MAIYKLLVLFRAIFASLCRLFSERTLVLWHSHSSSPSQRSATQASVDVFSSVSLVRSYFLLLLSLENHFGKCSPQSNTNLPYISHRHCNYINYITDLRAIVLIEALLLNSSIFVTTLYICTGLAVLVCRFHILISNLLRLCWLIFTIYSGFGKQSVYLCFYHFSLANNVCSVFYSAVLPFLMGILVLLDRYWCPRPYLLHFVPI